MNRARRLLTGLLAGMLISSLCLSGCGQKVEFDRPYKVYGSLSAYSAQEPSKELAFFASRLCVGGNQNLLAEGVTESLSGAAGLFDLDGAQILYAKNIHERLHPASTTKLMTAYLAIKYGNLSAMATVSERALDIDPGSSTCGLKVGDVISLEQLLYGLLMCSGNDAANVIAEMISGDVATFVELMNREAYALGATNSHFANPHGLTAEDHYTTVYDLYLIARAAMGYEAFGRIIQTDRYEASYTGRDGSPVEKAWTSTNWYLNGKAQAPEDVQAIGGKTGTTNEAGSCLALFSVGADGATYLSIVMRSESKDDLYEQMNELLKKISKI